jgi:hypothetical protein
MERGRTNHLRLRALSSIRCLRKRRRKPRDLPSWCVRW